MEIRDQKGLRGGRWRAQAAGEIAQHAPSFFRDLLRIQELGAPGAVTAGCRKHGPAHDARQPRRVILPRLVHQLQMPRQAAARTGSAQHDEVSELTQRAAVEREPFDHGLGRPREGGVLQVVHAVGIREQRAEHRGVARWRFVLRVRSEHAPEVRSTGGSRHVAQREQRACRRLLRRQPLEQRVDAARRFRGQPRQGERRARAHVGIRVLQLRQD